MDQMTAKQPESTRHCPPLPDFERLKFFYGQLLGVADFQTEQRFFLEKLRLINRCFHGVGIVCGLEVDAVPTSEDCHDEEEEQRKELQRTIADIDAEIDSLLDASRKDAKNDDLKQRLYALRTEKEHRERYLEDIPDCYPEHAPPSSEVLVHCGWALDCEGREIIVRQAQRVDLRKLLSAEQLHQVTHSAGNRQQFCIELSVCYCEQQTYPSRPILSDACAPVSKCAYGRVREGYKFRVSLTPSEPDNRCSTCCDECEYECVVLAHIHWDFESPITSENIDWRPRRSVSVYQPTVITGISWIHGATYTPEQAVKVLGTKLAKQPYASDGIEVTFSKPVHAETIQQGVVDLWRIHGGVGMSAGVNHMKGDFVDKPDQGLITSFKYRDVTGETLYEADRVLITIRTNFILDECCQPVDGEHIGGRVPQLPGYPFAEDDDVQSSLPPVPDCAATRRQPWTSGNGRPGSKFESWFFIHQTPETAS